MRPLLSLLAVLLAAGSLLLGTGARAAAAAPAAAATAPGATVCVSTNPVVYGGTQLVPSIGVCLPV